ncbi:helix-turn-helix domain-containing protein [Streptococcus cuniculi]|uniref:XRE family transcriptional regulator n=1 Tax=Streptococcus cuniculi TaxID=1432788 RepID=A0A4Y9JDA1_9STRE|nr:helix-turn-helix transcriptional regulator [Streptococcus cuniculi]MBF0777860.1 helix-turn-helix transcriptional regulator [Streptococcus cuniculi]TFU98158.1 XRE family transcriptional regulator [Streptococcus cuniculi]
MNKLANRLKELRIDNGKSKEELSAYLSISQSSYNRYEAGSRNPDYDTLIKIAIFYDVTLDYLLGRDDIEMPVFDRSQVVSYKDLVDKGLNPKLAHGLIAEIYSKQSFEERICRYPGDKTKYVLKKDVKALLESLGDDLL